MYVKRISKNFERQRGVKLNTPKYTSLIVTAEEYKKATTLIEYFCEGDLSFMIAWYSDMFFSSYGEDSKFIITTELKPIIKHQTETRIITVDSVFKTTKEIRNKYALPKSYPKEIDVLLNLETIGIGNASDGVRKLINCWYDAYKGGMYPEDDYIDSFAADLEEDNCSWGDI